MELKTHLGLKIGIFGGGQLARLLALEAHRMGLEPHILSENQEDPAAQVTSHWQQGDTKNIEHLSSFCKKMDLVTFESEFIPAEALKVLSKTFSKKIFPDASLLKALQDRLSQKTLLLENKILTSPFVALNEPADLLAAQQLFKTGLVAKTRLGGYDGKGTFILKSKKEVTHFLEKNVLTNHTFIVEKLISFRRELALQVARNKKGEVLFLPLVEIHQANNRLDWLQGPIHHPKLMSLQKKISAFLKKIDYVGIIAFELFDQGQELLVNEIAPRVHNSGHYSTEALSIDQFSLHLRAGLNQAFPKLAFRCKTFLMTNLIGEGSAKIKISEPFSGTLHWYGKSKNPIGRKMGHVTYLNSSPRLALLERKRMKL